MPTTSQMIDFIKAHTGYDRIESDTDIFGSGIVGDDFHELIDAFTSTYAVDMSSYLWYFHADEEGGWNSIGGMFFKPPYKKVNRIPITPAILTEIANKRKWDLLYPTHSIPTKRYDIIINRMLFLALVVWIIVLALKECGQ